MAFICAIHLHSRFGSLLATVLGQGESLWRRLKLSTVMHAGIVSFLKNEPR
jgi:hypothetical protein